MMKINGFDTAVPWTFRFSSFRHAKQVLAILWLIATLKVIKK